MKKYQFVAEAGTNHNGSYELAKKLIYYAKEANFTAIKFQMYNIEYFEEPFRPFLAKARLDSDQVYELRKECKRLGMGFFCSVFDCDSLGDYLDISDPKHPVKIPSSRIYDDTLVRAALRCNRRVILSTGMTDQERLIELAEMVSELAKMPPVICHCVSSYPTPFYDWNLCMIRELEKLFGPKCIYGYSDHSMDSSAVASKMAIAMGAHYIEHHIRLPNEAMDIRWVHKMEQRVSFSTPPGMKRYVENLQEAVSMMGEPRTGVYDCEKNIKKKYEI